jgi:hypothetical protein
MKSSDAGVGDTLPQIQSVLRDGSGTPIPLTDQDAVFLRWRRYMTGELPDEALATIVQPGAPVGSAQVGAVSYKLPVGGAFTPGTYEIEWRVVFASGDEATFPNYGTDVLVVGARL